MATSKDVSKSFSSKGLRMYPYGSVSLALSKVPRSAYEVRKTNGNSYFSLIIFAKSIPSNSPFIFISKITASTFCECNKSNALSERDAIPTISYPKFLQHLLISCAINGSSSTISNFILLVFLTSILLKEMKVRVLRCKLVVFHLKQHDSAVRSIYIQTGIQFILKCLNNLVAKGIIFFTNIAGVKTNSVVLNFQG